MYLDIVADQDLLLERVASSASPAPSEWPLLTTKGGENVVEVEATAKSTLSSSKTVEWVPTTAERIAAWCTTSTGVEAGSTELVVLLLLFGVGENFVGALNVGEAVLCRSVLVRIGMIFLREAVISLLDFRCRGRLANSKSFVWVFLQKAVGAVERLEVVS